MISVAWGLFINFLVFLFFFLSLVGLHFCFNLPVCCIRLFVGFVFFLYISSAFEWSTPECGKVTPCEVDLGRSDPANYPFPVLLADQQLAGIGIVLQQKLQAVGRGGQAGQIPAGRGKCEDKGGVAVHQVLP